MLRTDLKVVSALVHSISQHFLYHRLYFVKNVTQTDISDPYLTKDALTKLTIESHFVPEISFTE